MSNVLDRPRSSRARAGPATTEPAVAAAPIWLRGALAAGWAVAVGVASLVVVTLIIWAADSGTTASAGEAMRFAVQLWLLAHRDVLRVPGGGSLAVPPLVLTAAVGLLLARAAAVLARTTPAGDRRDLAVLAAAVTLPYAGCAALLAAVAPTSSLRPSVGAAFVSAAIVGGLAVTLGTAREWGMIRPTWRARSARTRSGLQAAGAAGAVLVLAATLLTAGSLVAHSADVGSLVGDYHGASGQAAMVVLSVLLVPNAVCAAVGYLAGPGFAVGAGTSVSYAGAHLGAVPAFPLLAAVPAGPPPWQVEGLFAAAVLAAGIVAGWRVSRRTGVAPRDQLRATALAAVTVGAGAAVLVGFAGGPAGPGRLSAVGASPWQVGLALAAEVAIVASATVAGRSWLNRPRS